MQPRSLVADMTPYEPGKPIEEVQREFGLTEVFKLASNENPLGPSPKALEAIRLALPDLHRYPDGSATLLRHDLAAFHKLAPGQILVGNGSDEILQLVALAYLEAGDRTLTARCTFSEYDFCSRLLNAPCDTVPLKQWTYDLDAMFHAIKSSTKVIFISNPNNPTGTYVSHDDLKRFLAQVPQHILVVLDEAYAEFVRASDYPRSLQLLQQHPNLLVLRTFSKIYGLAGLRVGYGMGHEELIRILHKVRQPFNVNSLAQIAARAALQDQEHVSRTRRCISDQMPLLDNGLRQVGCQTVPSQANFIFASTPVAGRFVFQQLLRHGVIIRPMDGFGEPKAIRVTISSLIELGRLLGLLPAIFGKS